MGIIPIGDLFELVMDEQQEQYHLPHHHHWSISINSFWCGTPNVNSIKFQVSFPTSTTALAPSPCLHFCHYRKRISEKPPLGQLERHQLYLVFCFNSRSLWNLLIDLLLSYFAFIPQRLLNYATLNRNALPLDGDDCCQGWLEKPSSHSWGRDNILNIVPLFCCCCGWAF